MGLATTPRHRAETSRAQAFADLRRRAAQLVVGRDLYADDAILRSNTTRTAEATEDDAVWSALHPGSGAARRTVTA